MLDTVGIRNMILDSSIHSGFARQIVVTMDLFHRLNHQGRNFRQLRCRRVQWENVDQYLECCLLVGCEYVCGCVYLFVDCGGWVKYG